MNRPHSSSRAFLSALFTAAILLRVAVPAGYMPTNMGDGWYLQLCPEGMSAQVMSALFGNEHEHAHHHPETAEAFTQCELGGGLTGEALTGLTLDAVATFKQLSSSTPSTDWLPPTNVLRRYHPRAPPSPV